MSTRRRNRAMKVVVGVVIALAALGCTPASGQHATRQFALDDYCTLEVRNVPGDAESYVAAREFGVLWVDGTITGGPSQGCGTWYLISIAVTTTQTTKQCGFTAEYGGPPPSPGCTAYAPDWYQTAAAGPLVSATIRMCKDVDGTLSSFCEGGYVDYAVYP